MPRSNIDAWLAQPKSAVAIVGATGWVGRAVLHAVLKAAPDLPPERLRLFASRQKSLAVEGRIREIEAMAGSSALGSGRWLVVHAGFIGGEPLSGADVRHRNDELLDSVLALARQADTNRLVAISSGAAGFASEAAEPKAAYATMKRDHEDCIRQWSLKTGRRTLVPRIFNLGGPYITGAENYALGDFILRLSRDRRLAIGAAHPVFRSYAHVLEVAKTLLEMAVDDAEDGEPFDVMGDQVIELGELAHMIKLALGATAAKITRPAPNVDTCDWYVGDGRRYQMALFKAGRKSTPLLATVMDTIRYLQAEAPPQDRGFQEGKS